ncbi:putative S-crystallin SL11 [Hypsibius exemplaris]|uniref:glutathione transferase n=1 Tax=Hypsibius exemplaris TaxID=2072580 RepID=A0A1W0WAD2_HYPEX|nr:putative S-crystallin SL11 [Hypsibius exemplaris]
MAVRYKLYYFDAQGRGELVRLILHAVGEEFEDIRVHQALWEQLKPSTPLHTLPVLEIDGKQLAQSSAIARYLAGVFDLGGRNNLEKALVDSAAELIDEILSDALKIIFEHDKRRKAKALKQFVTVTLPQKLARLEEFKLAHGKGYGYIFGNDLTYADLAAHNAFDQIVSGSIVEREVLEQYSYPAELRRRIFDGEPRISRYIKHRNQMLKSL